jgi:hypothetical protein
VSRGGPAGLFPVLAALLLAVPLSGCSGADSGREAALGSLRFPATMRVATTPDDPFEAVGDLRVAWQGTVFAIASEGEGDLARRSVVDGALAYTTNQGIAWTRHPWPESLGTVSARLLLWNVRALAEDPALAMTVEDTAEGRNLTFAGTLVRGVREYPVRLELGVRGDDVVWARLDAPAGRESPFTFRPVEGFPFPAQAPAASRTPDEASTGERASHPSHVQILGWIQDYRQTRGTLPPEPSPDALRLQLLASGKEWPRNAFDGQPIANRRASGHFEWTRCGDQDGDYRGLGHDGILVQQVFGAGCKTL